MTDPALSEASELDFATLELDFEGFRALARNPNLDSHGRIGFPTSYREGFERGILEDIVSKLPALTQSTGQTFVDIGPGCANLPKMLIDLCRERRHRLILVDSQEMLSQLPDDENVVVKCVGQFPRNAEYLSELAGSGVTGIICYSVLHYIYLDTNLFDALDAAIKLLANGGRALFGDIPNASKRRRFFASETGRRFHAEFTGSESSPRVDFNELSPGRIDDAVLSGLIQRAQLAGFDAYLLPQSPNLPMANRRDDLLIVRP